MLASLIRAAIAIAMILAPFAMAQAMTDGHAGMAGMSEAHGGSCPDMPESEHLPGQPQCAVPCLGALVPVATDGPAPMRTKPPQHAWVPAIGAPLVCEVATPPPRSVVVQTREAH